jgi:alpha/beta superfamily hydrolase
MTRLDIPTSHGRLEALWQPEPSPRALALVCHPHPLYGGTMQNTATYRIAKAWNDVGCSALRFNFRGVGGSTGLSGSGDGVPELEDALVAFDWLAAQSTGGPLFVSGFSFGARTALQVAIARPQVKGAVVLGYPASLFDSSFLSELKAPSTFIHAEHDEFASLSAIRSLLASMQSPTSLIELEDSDHMATGRLDALSVRLKQALERLSLQERDGTVVAVDGALAYKRLVNGAWVTSSIATPMGNVYSL